MNRRNFLKAGLMGGTIWTLGRFGLWRPDLLAGEVDPVYKAIPIWDAHAHPYSFFSDNPDPSTPTIAMMKEMGVAVCVFAAVGDLVLTDRRKGRGNSPKFDTTRQLDRVKDWAKSDEIKIIKTTTDLDRLRPGQLGAIVAIEGGDALEGRLENLDYFFEEFSVRLITLLHDTHNAIGRHQREVPSEEGLTPFGRSVVERMNRLGMIIDVAHAQTNTLRDITALTTKPVVDSHTGLTVKALPFSRLRSWEEMEWVAKGDGVICTWPLSHRTRNTLVDWAKEIVAMKSRLGLSYIGLGTDGGGRLPKTLEGYTNISDLGKLVRAMTEVGLDQADIRAFLSGNLERVVRANLRGPKG
ncbi:MAG: hypothetical protein C0407_14470 [Desulfobacca sp.]|nr:hypothetical protein [Desulfobacca sp.]